MTTPQDKITGFAFGRAMKALHGCARGRSMRRLAWCSAFVLLLSGLAWAQVKPALTLEQRIVNAKAQMEKPCKDAGGKWAYMLASIDGKTTAFFGCVGK